jgi:hypothetical protein
MVRKLLYLNGLAIIGVILFHTAGTGFTAMFAWGHRHLPDSVPVMSQVGSFRIMACVFSSNWQFSAFRPFCSFPDFLWQ